MNNGNTGKEMGKNRSIEAKRVKYIRQQKARPRYLKMNNGQMKVSQSVDQSKIPREYRGLFAYRDRGNSFVDEFLEAKFPSHIVVRTEQVIAVNERPLRTVFVEGKFRKLVMFSDTRMTCFYFVEFLTLPGLVRRSVNYNSHTRALQVYNLQSIRWQETLHIPNVEQQSPLEYST